MKRETVAGVATVRLLCKTFGVSRQAYYASQKAPEPSAKVLRLPVRPDVAPAAKVLASIKVVIGENPAWGVRKVWAALRREHELKVSKKRVWAIMKANGLVLARDSCPCARHRLHLSCVAARAHPVLRSLRVSCGGTIRGIHVRRPRPLSAAR